MSKTGLLDSDKIRKKSYHRRNDSGELGVFEAARYFSGYNEAASGYNGSCYSQKIIRDERHGNRGRISLDMPNRNLLIHQQSHVMDKQVLKEKKHKQPSSPGGRLAHFLNSLFSQSASKKKKSKSSTQCTRDEEEISPNGRRRRRSSISHFRSSSTAPESKSTYSCSSSGFRTPPAYAQTPTKICKDLKSFSDHKQPLSLSKCSAHVNATTLEKELWGDRKQGDLSWLDEKYKEKIGYSEKDRSLVEKYASEEKELNEFNEVEDDGGESDSSSDLFELQNYDLSSYPSGLPVYETTNVDNVKRGTPISNGPM